MLEVRTLIFLLYRISYSWHLAERKLTKVAKRNDGRVKKLVYSKIRPIFKGLRRGEFAAL